HTRFSRDWSSDVYSSDLLQQRLRRNAADVETGPAETGAAFDASGLQPELRCPDRRDIAARPRPDNHDVVTIRHRAEPHISNKMQIGRASCRERVEREGGG